MPTSAARASPGPLTTQPITATVMGLVQPANRRSTSRAMGIMSYFVRPQVGQEMRFGPVCRSPAAERISLAAHTSSMPMADFSTPIRGVPASVTPKCRG